MSAEEITAILQLVAALTPEAIKLANRIGDSIQAKPEADRLGIIKSIADSLQPMTPK